MHTLQTFLHSLASLTRLMTCNSITLSLGVRACLTNANIYIHVYIQGYTRVDENLQCYEIDTNIVHMFTKTNTLFISLCIHIRSQTQWTRKSEETIHTSRKHLQNDL